MKTVDISFLVQGHITQTIELPPDCNLTGDEIIEQLDSGKMLTTIQEGGDVIMVNSEGIDIVASVLNVDNELEYSDYELKREDES